MTRPVTVVLAMALAGCGGDEQPTSTISSSSEPVASTPIDEASSVGGELLDAVAGDSWLWVRWRPVPGAERYGVELASKSASFSRDPAHVVPKEQDSLRVDGLKTGEPLKVRVAWMDGSSVWHSGEEVARLTPAPVMRVGADVPSIAEALDQAVGQPAVNVWVRSGRCQTSLVLFGGMSVFGGFGEGFDVERRQPAASPTILVPETERDLVVVAPDDAWAGLSGVSLDGLGKASRGIVGDDCRLFLHHVTITGCRRRGLHLRSEEDRFSFSSLSMIGGGVRECGGEGILVEGAASVSLRRIELRDNAHEGLECDPLSSAPGRNVRLLLDGCHVTDNGDIGVDLEMRWPNELGVAAPRIDVRRTRIERNGSHGIAVDTPEPADATDRVEVTIEDCLFRSNGGVGLQLDADHPGSYTVIAARFCEGDGAGLALSGDAPNATIHLERIGWWSGLGSGLECAISGALLCLDCVWFDHARAFTWSQGSVSWQGCARAPGAVAVGLSWPDAVSECRVLSANLAAPDVDQLHVRAAWDAWVDRTLAIGE